MFEIYGLRKKQRKGTMYFHIAVNLMCTFSYVNLIFSFLLCIFAVKLVILFWCKALNLSPNYRQTNDISKLKIKE